MATVKRFVPIVHAGGDSIDYLAECDSIEQAQALAAADGRELWEIETVYVDADASARAWDGIGILINRAERPDDADSTRDHIRPRLFDADMVAYTLKLQSASAYWHLTAQARMQAYALYPDEETRQDAIRAQEYAAEESAEYRAILCA